LSRTKKADMRYPKSQSHICFAYSDLTCLLFLNPRKHESSSNYPLPHFATHVTLLPQNAKKKKKTKRENPSDACLPPNAMRQTHHPHQNTHPLTLRFPSRGLNRKSILTPVFIHQLSASSPHFPASSTLPLPSKHHSPSKHPLDRLTNHHPILVFLMLYHIAIELHYLHQRAFVEGLLIRWFAEFACG